MTPMATIRRMLLLAALLLAFGTTAAGTLGVTVASAHSGGFGLRAALSSCDDPLTPIAEVPGPTLAGALQFEACEILQADAVRVTAGDIVFRAGSAIVLGNGFAVQTGVRWTASIEPALSLTAYVEDDSPAAEPAYAALFHLRLDALRLAAGDGFEHFVAYAADATPELVLSIRRVGTEHLLALDVRRQDGSFVTTEGTPNELLVPVGYQQVDVTWRAADPGSANGVASVEVAGQRARLEGVDNAAARIDFVAWGVLSGKRSATSSGSLDLDDLSSTRAF